MDHRIIPCCLVALALFLDATCLPFHPGSDAHDSDTSDAGPHLGKLKRMVSLGTEEGNVGVEATNPSVFGYGCSCYQTGPPEDDMMWLKKLAVEEPHPMLVLSELAESMHRHLVCKDHCPGSINPQGESDIVKDVTTLMLTYLNTTTQQRTQDPCPPIYRIRHYPKRYPRYLVDVVCPESGCSQCSSGASGICSPSLGPKMPYLTSDPSDCVGASTTSGVTWEKCGLEVGVGCSCKTE